MVLKRKSQVGKNSTSDLSKPQKSKDLTIYGLEVLSIQGFNEYDPIPIQVRCLQLFHMIAPTSIAELLLQLNARFLPVSHTTSWCRFEAATSEPPSLNKKIVPISYGVKTKQWWHSTLILFLLAWAFKS